MLTKRYEITEMISSLSLLIGFIAILIGGIVWWKRNSGKEKDYQLVNIFLMQIQQIQQMKN